MGQTFIGKNFGKEGGLRETVPGQIVEIKPEVALSHDNTVNQNIFKDGGY
jgi:hypothetical protein